jgi:ABC-type polysaccharide/polyol phosphate transport system ATPase subunit
MSAQAAVVVDGLSKSFRFVHGRAETMKERFLHPLRRSSVTQFAALRDVSFEIEEGEAFAVIGPNGSGKSTLLKILAGIYQPTDGTVRVRGRVAPFVDLGVGFNPELDARSNIRVNGTLLGIPPRQLRENVDEILAFAELEEFADQKIKNYSSGMQLRLAYAVAMQAPADVMLLDEVFAVGDQDFQRKCYGTFAKQHQEGRTIVIVTHDPTIVGYCSRALLLRQGEVDAIGVSHVVLARYASQAAHA